MRFLALVFMGIVVVIMLRPSCARKSVAKDCALVCGDIGMAHDYATPSGVFTYKCHCKKIPQPVEIKTRP